MKSARQTLPDRTASATGGKHRSDPSTAARAPRQRAAGPALENQADRVALHLAGSDPSAELAAGMASRSATHELDRLGPAAASLPASVRQPAEQLLGHDFSSVRVHADAHAAHRTQNENAHATADREDIYFNRGRYRPDHPLGRALIWHELTHVAQQRDPADAKLDPAMLQAMADAHADHEQPLFGRGRMHLDCKGCGGCSGDSSSTSDSKRTSDSSGGQRAAGADGGTTAGAATKLDPNKPPAGLDAKYTDYYSDINSAVAALNSRLKPPTPLDPDWIRAMMATESIRGTKARKYDPLQTSNRGDKALETFKKGKDHSELIDPGLRAKLANKITTPHKGKVWSYDSLNDKERMDAATGILLGVAFLYLKAATFTYVTDETGELLTTAVTSADKHGFTSVAKRVGTTVGVLQKYNRHIDSSKLRVDTKLEYKKATQSWKITKWSTWKDAIEAYNGGGVSDYYTRVKTHHDAIKKGSQPKGN